MYIYETKTKCHFEYDVHTFYISDARRRDGRFHSDDDDDNSSILRPRLLDTFIYSVYNTRAFDERRSYCNAVEFENPNTAERRPSFNSLYENGTSLTRKNDLWDFSSKNFGTIPYRWFSSIERSGFRHESEIFYTFKTKKKKTDYKRFLNIVRTLYGTPCIVIVRRSNFKCSALLFLNSKARNNENRTGSFFTFTRSPRKPTSVSNIKKKYPSVIFYQKNCSQTKNQHRKTVTFSAA